MSQSRALPGRHLQCPDPPGRRAQLVVLEALGQRGQLEILALRVRQVVRPGLREVRALLAPLGLRVMLELSAQRALLALRVRPAQRATQETKAQQALPERKAQPEAQAQCLGRLGLQAALVSQALQVQPAMLPLFLDPRALLGPRGRPLPGLQALLGQPGLLELDQIFRLLMKVCN